MAGVKRLSITAEFIERWQTGTELHTRITKGLPEDAKIISALFDKTSRLLQLEVQSKYFLDEEPTDFKYVMIEMERIDNAKEKTNAESGNHGSVNEESAR